MQDPHKGWLKTSMTSQAEARGAALARRQVPDLATTSHANWSGVENELLQSGGQSYLWNHQYYPFIRSFRTLLIKVLLVERKLGDH